MSRNFIFHLGSIQNQTFYVKPVITSGNDWKSDPWKEKARNSDSLVYGNINSCNKTLRTALTTKRKTRANMYSIKELNGKDDIDFYRCHFLLIKPSFKEKSSHRW